MVEEIQCTLHCPQTAEGCWPSKNPQSCVSQEQSILLYMYIYSAKDGFFNRINSLWFRRQRASLTAMELISLSISARSSKIRLLKAVSGPERFFFMKVLRQYPLQDSCQLFNIDIIFQLRFGLNLN